MFRRKSCLVATYSCSAFFNAALVRASKDRMVLLNCVGSIECLLLGNLFFIKEGISWVGLYLERSGLFLIGGFCCLFWVFNLDCDIGFFMLLWVVFGVKNLS